VSRSFAGYGYLPSRVFREKVLLDCLGKDVPQIRPHLQHPVLRPGFGQLVQVHLQGEAVKVLERDAVEAAVSFSNFFTLAVSLFQLASFKGKNRFRTNQPNVTEPSLHDPTTKFLPRLLGYLLLQFLPGLAFCQLLVHDSRVIMTGVIWCRFRDQKDGALQWKILFFSLCLCLCGGMLYVWMI
jgi:hypothetical protein